MRDAFKLTAQDNTARVVSLVEALNGLSREHNGKLQGPTTPAQATAVVQALGLSIPIVPSEIEQPFRRAEVLLLPRNILKAGLVVDDVGELKRRLSDLYDLLGNVDVRRKLEVMADGPTTKKPGLADSLEMNSVSLPRLVALFNGKPATPRKAEVKKETVKETVSKVVPQPAPITEKPAPMQRAPTPPRLATSTFTVRDAPRPSSTWSDFVANTKQALSSACSAVFLSKRESLEEAPTKTEAEKPEGTLKEWFIDVAKYSAAFAACFAWACYMFGVQAVMSSLYYWGTVLENIVQGVFKAVF